MGTTGLTGKYQECDLWPQYRRHILKFLDIKRPLKIVIDASNGMAGKMIPAVFGDVPNLEIIPVLFEINGFFVHEPNPLVDRNLKWTKDKVLETGADLGACFDGDADRVFFVDETGTTVGCDLVTALLARDFLTLPGNRKARIVYDLRASHVVAEEIIAGGGVPQRERVGHAFIKKTMSETSAVFGGELSGHFYFRENFYADSGAIALARLLSVFSAQPKTLRQLMQPIGPLPAEW